MLEAFFTPRRFGCEEPEWPRPKAKKREYGGFFRWVFRADFEARRRGLLQEWEPPDARTPDLLRY
jgi:hypothetical protein